MKDSDVPVLAFDMAAVAGSTFASNDDVRVDAPRDQWLTIPQITEKFTSQGYDVRKVEAEEGGYEVYALGKDGQCLEAYVHPITGEPLKGEVED